MTTTNTAWKFQTTDETAVHTGLATDARGLRLRAQCGYGWVHMGDASGWLQLTVAISVCSRATCAAPCGGIRPLVDSWRSASRLPSTSRLTFCPGLANSRAPA